MKRLTKLCALLLVLGLMLGIGGFAAGGRLYRYDKGSWTPFPVRSWGWSFVHGAERFWDDCREWDDDNDRHDDDDWNNKNFPHTKRLPGIPPHGANR